VFAPWFEGKQNIELIYRQIVDGLERGEGCTLGQDGFIFSISSAQHATSVTTPS
jgi:hypothetical protein